MTSKVVIEVATAHYNEVLNALKAIKKGEELYDGVDAYDRLKFNLKQLLAIAIEGKVR